MIRHLLSISDLTARDIEGLLALTARCKGNGASFGRALAGKAVALIFEKSSTRTRLACEVAVGRLGGRPVTIAGTDLQVGRGETLEDTARIFSRFVDAVCWRTTGHDRLEAFAKVATIPVINTLSDAEHPCQILADLFTIRERFGRGRWPSVAFVGDAGNNVAHSWLLAAGTLGMDLRLAYPSRHQPDLAVRTAAAKLAKASGAKLTFTNDPAEAAKGADVLYTDVWVSMGQEAERGERLKLFRPYQIGAKLMKLASVRAVVMHCLPAHRGEELTAEVMDSEKSIVFDQAENRLYNAMAALLWCTGGGKS
ncbi:MAG: ornithine carbamoyltransferase [Candidatus Coatesbacteria bacterium]